MRWLLALLGFIFGAGLADSLGLPVLQLAVLCTVAGFFLPQLARRKNGTGAARAAGYGQHPSNSPQPNVPLQNLPLPERVLRLEREVAQLRAEMAQLRTHGPAAEGAAGTLPPAQAATAAAGTLPTSADAEVFPGPVPTSVDADVFPAPAAAPPPTPIASDDAADRDGYFDTPPVQTPAAAAAHASAGASGHASATVGANVNAGATATASAAKPRQPDPFERGVAAIRGWLLGGNTVVRVGMVVLFFGIAFLLKYAADNDMFPVEFRLAGVAGAAIVLLAAGWRLRARRHAYGLVLQGGGIGILYLTVFAATRLYALLPPGAALPLMIVICVFSALLAVQQNAAVLAFMGSAGGFLAPVLLSTGGGSHVTLFSYYALLNAGILAVAWFKAWRSLNLLGFAFTFGIGALWGASAYQPALFASTEPFLLLFFLMYVGIALLYALRRDLALMHYVDGTLVFGTPLVTILLQAALVQGKEFALAYSALALSAFYLLLAAWLRRGHARLALLFEAMLALAVLFATLAVPLAFSGPTTSAVWAIEGAAIVWVSVRQRRLLALAFALLLQVAAALAFFGVEAKALFLGGMPPVPVLNGNYIGKVLIAIAALFSAWQLNARGSAGKPAAAAWRPELSGIGVAMAVWGLLWWTCAGLYEIFYYFSSDPYGSPGWKYALDADVLFLVLTAWLAHALRRALDWPLARWPGVALPPALAIIGALASLAGAPLSNVVALPLGLLLSWLLLYRERDDLPPRLLGALHTLSFWTLCALLTMEGYVRLGDWVPEGTWQWSAWAYGYGLMLLLLAGPGARLAWPVRRHAHAYLVWGATPLALLLWGWSLLSVFSDGDAAPLFYLPLLNPLDVAILLAALAGVVWVRRLDALALRPAGTAWSKGSPLPRTLAALTAFVWLNAMLLRSLHHWTGVAYDLDALSASTLVQAAVSVFWTVCALATMILATRRGSRPLWFTGAGLLGITVVKLFLFDLSYLSGISRIVAFIGIGLLLLLIGYFSPLPPRKAGAAEDAS
ncbi:MULTISPECIES: DUF2339 domain-containing protein [unclassified Achromobacter]|uniref:DUF2339 domain-containing protein n=1 Tax=unclassified Achromobacter TaxID=2626865 RepID=UPI000B51DFE5|nr:MULTISPECIES: DUF2339 domain-containing protein [unclassified Achromobacter]OWT73468.1 hypothetical protein CEY05_20340 [Achromobacter sp. HZ34]OWT79613.1 hypothetical protein CEY04_11640 [Achromobacter sp. HZ28]